ncbi:hypothetical protein AX14_004821, partial [Amanita brunnescens Koide BX004]
NHELLKVLGSKEYCTTDTMRHHYPDTKLLDLLFVRALADRLGNIPAIVNAVDPGYTISELRRNVSLLGLSVVYLLDLLPTEKSSRRLAWGASGGKDEEKLRGDFHHCGQVSEPSDFVISDQGREVRESTWIRVP